MSKIEPVAVIRRNEAGQITMQTPEHDAFDMSRHVGKRLYTEDAITELERENAALLAANKDCILHFEALKADYDAMLDYALKLREALEVMVAYDRERGCGLKIADDALALPLPEAMKEEG